MANIICPSCSTENKADMRFCASCGEPLAKPGGKPLRQKTVVMASGEKPVSKPAKSKRNDTELVPSKEPAQQPAPAKETVHLPRLRASLVFENGKEIALARGPQFDIGRKDLANDWDPAIDLTPFGGEEGGVSRRHGFILQTESGLQIQDIGSLNGTLLNGDLLEPNRPYALQHGDEIAFGAIPARLIVE